MAKRKTLTKKTRFEVFKRDAFTCMYCGKTPPDAMLEIDHIIPVSKNGDNELDNLVTSCFDCNRGKKNIELSKIPNKIQENYEILTEKETQYREYRKMLDGIREREDAEIDRVDDIVIQYSTEYSYNKEEPSSLSHQFKSITLRKFIKKLDVNEVCDAMTIALNKIKPRSSYSLNNALKYFCGICWNKIKEKNG